MQKSLSPQTMTSREFDRHTGRAKRVAEEGPVVITDCGRPAYVLMKYAEYECLASKKSIVDLLRDDRPEADFEFEFPRMSDDMGFRVPDFSEG